MRKYALCYGLNVNILVDVKVSAFYEKNPLWFLRHHNIKVLIFGSRHSWVLSLTLQGFGFLLVVTGTVTLTLEMAVYLLVDVHVSTYPGTVLQSVLEGTELLVLIASWFSI